MNPRQRALFAGTALAAGAMSLWPAASALRADAARSWSNIGAFIEEAVMAPEPAAQRREVADTPATGTPRPPAAVTDGDEFHPRRPC